MITSWYESVEWMDIRVVLGGSVKVNIKFKIGVFGFIVKVGCADAPWNVRPREPKVQSKGPNQQDTYSRGDCEGERARVQGVRVHGVQLKGGGKRAY